MNNGFAAAGASDLAVDPSSGAVYAAAGDSIFKSTDGGANWRRLNAKFLLLGWVPRQPAFVRSLAIDPITPTTLYAATGGAGVFRSADGGSSWSAANNGLTELGVDALAIAPSSPSTLYAATSAGSAPSSVFRSTDGGSSWMAVNNGFDRSSPPSGLAVDAGQPGTVYLAAGKRFKTTDGGANWADVGVGLVVAIDPVSPMTVYVGTGFGVLKTVDAGASWMYANGTLTSVRVRSLVAVPGTSSTLYAATSSGVFRGLAGGASWTSVNGGLQSSVRQIATDPISPETLYAGTYYGGAFKTSNAGRTWAPVNDGLTLNSVYGLAVDPVFLSTVYAAATYLNPGFPSVGRAGAEILKSTQGGAKWTSVKSTFTDTRSGAIAIDPSSSSIVYAATGGVGVLKSLDGGATWSPRNEGLPTADIRALGIDPTSPSTVYAGGGFGCFRSLDGGATWQPINSGLTNKVVNALALDPASPGTLYAGTNGGVFRSADRGSRWIAVSDGLTDWTVNSLAVDPVEPLTLYAGTERSGVFKITFVPVEEVCPGGPTTLCLTRGRFRVEVQWRVANHGTSGVGQAVPVTDSAGAFWFFDPANIELVVKVLDGRAINGRFWLFYGALSNVEYTITVTDTHTGDVKTYFNPQGRLASAADTSAF